MAHHKVCPLCSSAEVILYTRCADHLISKEVFDLFKCNACNFLFTQDSPEENAIGRYYESENYISHSDISKGPFNKIYFLARSFMLKRKKRIIRKATGLKTGTLLDIGSGTGYFANLMKESGWAVKAIEINKTAREFSISRFDLDVIDPVEIASVRANSFDCITLWHVLEHFHNPFKYASEILRLLKPGGVCLIALPNCSSYDAKYYGSYWAAYDVPRHLWHFSPDTFRIFSEKTGFIIEDFRILPLDVFYISSLSEKYKGSIMPIIKGMSRAMRFAFLCFFKKYRSSSIAYILRKSG
jgi:2-polyprenyl-3-methyl-5-hydroxy-6-metoxy-1,4-benzoquinol methylase